jgi:hypothetical protein
MLPSNNHLRQPHHRHNDEGDDEDEDDDDQCIDGSTIRYPVVGGRGAHRNPPAPAQKQQPPLLCDSHRLYISVLSPLFFRLPVYKRKGRALFRITQPHRTDARETYRNVTSRHGRCWCQCFLQRLPLGRSIDRSMGSVHPPTTYLLLAVCSTSTVHFLLYGSQLCPTDQSTFLEEHDVVVR